MLGNGGCRFFNGQLTGQVCRPLKSRIDFSEQRGAVLDQIVDAESSEVTGPTQPWANCSSAFIHFVEDIGSDGLANEVIAAVPEFAPRKD